MTLLYRNIPPSILRHGTENGLNTDLITWSAATSIPLALILCVAVPLRLVSYASLGTNFTFALTEPDRLTTTGIYSYVQHPSYTGLVIILVCNVALLCRMDGVLSCWIPPRWYQTFRTLERILAPVALSVLIFGMWTRVRQEERFLRAQFGVEWESWHAATPRFIPWLF
jgi:protein-S-isoprenylcysteine O-methyltransferase Ste14